MAKRESQRIHWCFRANYNGDINAFDEGADEEVLYLIGQLTTLCVAFAFQLESAPTTGYLHFQGYFQLLNRNRKGPLLRDLFPFEYLSPMKGKVKQAWGYATKTDTRLYGPWTLGAPEEIELKERLSDFVAACPNLTEAEAFARFPNAMVRYYHTYHRIHALTKPVRTTPLEVYVFYGPPGTGKSRMADELYPTAYEVPWSQKTWVTPRGNKAEVVIFQDFTGEMYLKQFNRYVDRYPQEVECKGGFLWWCPNIILITTNVLPTLWYKQEGRQDVLGQIHRRITACYDFTGWNYDRDWPTRTLPPSYSCQELAEKYGPRPLQPYDGNHQRQNFNSNFVGLNIY